MTTKNQEAERRVLDMLAGWSNYDNLWPEATENEIKTLVLENDKVCDLYQEFGQLANDLSLEQIEQFIKDKIIPFILNG